MYSPGAGRTVPICGDDGIAKGIDALRLRLQLCLRHRGPVFSFLEFATHLVCCVAARVC